MMRQQPKHVPTTQKEIIVPQEEEKPFDRAAFEKTHHKAPIAVINNNLPQKAVVKTPNTTVKPLKTVVKH
jgi:hypothetical protein